MQIQATHFPRSYFWDILLLESQYQSPMESLRFVVAIEQRNKHFNQFRPHQIQSSEENLF